MSRFFSKNTNSTTAANSAVGGSLIGERPPSENAPAAWLSINRILMWVTFVLLCVLGAGLLLRYSVSKLSDPRIVITDGEVRPVSTSRLGNSNGSLASDEQLREKARSFDERLLSDRRDREWVYQTQDLPDVDDARQLWQQEVKEIEKQIAEAHELEAKILANEPNQDPGLFEAGSVLSDRIRRLEQLREDAPVDY